MASTVVYCPAPIVKGYKKTVYLNKDGSCKLKVKYMGKQDSATEYSGNLTWNDKGNTITLKEESQPVSYFVGENTLTQLI